MHNQSRPPLPLLAVLCALLAFLAISTTTSPRANDEPDEIAAPASRSRARDAIDDHLTPRQLEAKDAVQQGQFPGFPAPEANYHRTPNAMTDIRARIIRNGGGASAASVLDYILRHTWGYQEFGIAKRITLDEFTNGRKYKDGSRMDLGAGPSRRTIVDALTYLERRGYIVVDVDDSDRGRVAKYYRLHMRAG